MIVIYAKCVVSGPNVDRFLEVAGHLVDETRKEERNISYELVHSREAKNIYAFVERWPDDEALAVHMKSKHFIEAAKQLDRLLVVPLEITTHSIVK